MAASGGEAVLKSSSSPEAILARTVQDITDCVSELKHDYESEEDLSLPVTDDSQVLQRFCAKLEFLLQAGIKNKTSLLGNKKDYWDYICNCISATKGMGDGIKFVKTLSELKTSVGRGRAYIRFCLVHQRLADTIQQCAYNGRVTSEWYHPKSFWFQEQLVLQLVNCLYDLNSVQFDLSPRGYDLDSSWPSFARKNFGSPLYNWRPPSRTTSISSLNSIPNLEGVAPFEADESLVEEDSISIMGDLEKQNADLEAKVKELEEAAKEKDTRIQDLESEVKGKDKLFAEREKLLKDNLDATHQSIKSLEQQIELTNQENKLKMTQQKFDSTEATLKLAAKDKLNEAMELDLKGATAELASKQTINEKKTKLIDLLDAKVVQLDQKNKDLMEKMEKTSKERLGEFQEFQDSKTHIKELVAELHETKRAYDTARSSNNEMKQMLHSLQEKGQKIANLAKEKVKGYAEENKNLKALLEDLTKVSQSSGGDAAAMEETARKKLIDIQKELGEKTVQVNQLKSDLDSLRTTLEKSKQAAKGAAAKGAAAEGAAAEGAAAPAVKPE